MHRSFSYPCIAVVGALLASCAPVEFYAQAVVGQSSLLLARRDVQEVIDDPRTDSAVVAKLRLVSSLLRYAEEELALPVGGRYRTYVELSGAPVWNVVATPEFDLRALRRCYPVVGCAVYRGYFSQRAAAREGARLALDHDVHIYAAAAYSTLGWFDDPVLSSFIHYGEADLADLIFHELAHSVIYVPDDSLFNESFASFVGTQSARAWLASRGEDADAYQAELEAKQQSKQAYHAFLNEWRGRLAELYRQPVGDDAKRQLKAELFAALRIDYQRRRDRLGGGRYDAAVAKPFNNARLALIATYESLRPGFARLFRTVGGDWLAFYAAVEELAALPPAQRRSALGDDGGGAEGR